VLVGALSGWLFAPRQRIWSAMILILIAGVYFFNWEKSRGETEITVMPLNAATPFSWTPLDGKTTGS
jgi:hypothetical protein